MKTKAPPIALAPEDLARVRRCLDLLQEAQELKRAWNRVDRRRAELLQRALLAG